MKLLLKTLVAALLVTASTASAQFVAVFNPASPFISALPGGGRIDGQTFTATTGGTIGVVTVLAQRLGPNPTSITFELRSVSGGLPTSAILASTSVSTAGLSTLALSNLSADFSGFGVGVSAGDVLALTLRATSLFALGGVADGYSGGAQVISMNAGTSFSFFPPARDLHFSVGLAPTPVPEASTFGAGAAALLAGIVIWRKMRRPSSHA